MRLCSYFFKKPFHVMAAGGAPPVWAIEKTRMALYTTALPCSGSHEICKYCTTHSSSLATDFGLIHGWLSKGPPVGCRVIASPLKQVLSQCKKYTKVLKLPSTQDRKSETTLTGVLELGINFLVPMMVESVARDIRVGQGEV